MRFNSMIKWFLVAGLVIAQLQAYADTNSVRYKNQRGSVLEFTKHPSADGVGSLTGSFVTAVGNCKTDMNVPVPISGYYNGNVVAISINFPHCKQVVSLTGNLSNNETNLNTLWLDASQATDPIHANWNSNIVGADSYTKEN